MALVGGVKMVPFHFSGGWVSQNGGCGSLVFLRNAMDESLWFSQKCKGWVSLIFSEIQRMSLPAFLWKSKDEVPCFFLNIKGWGSLLFWRMSLPSLCRITLGPNVSTTPITAMGCRQCLPLSVVQLKGKHCRKPHCRNGVVDTFRLGVSSLISGFSPLQRKLIKSN